ncbi:hypothetical protein AURDEDRAFT_176851 [Auricularia subglabra TFB-10046 SS5]|uniref:14-3-3 domain-containing protein n=1 Tax=Auricularia subglabra (strain TFB-10046 / SS5) TaxID=717982 RepID=J0D5N6_AURST|nr:hypothetical protein AURDEDRAFT_176851 [Auricularia subglabra TFB-10046 SS5]
MQYLRELEDLENGNEKAPSASASLNFSVFYYDILHPRDPTALATRSIRPLDDAIAEVYTLSEESYTDSTLIIQTGPTIDKASSRVIRTLPSMYTLQAIQVGMLDLGSDPIARLASVHRSQVAFSESIGGLQ